jgi:hypothetical protein
MCNFLLIIGVSTDSTEKPLFHFLLAMFQPCKVIFQIFDKPLQLFLADLIHFYKLLDK